MVRRPKPVWLFPLLAVLLFLFVASPAGGGGSAGSVRRFTLVLFNDWYRLEGVQGRRRGGAARLKTVLSRLRARGEVLALFAGDLLSPSLMSREFRGVQMIEALNAAGLDVATFGNHEFDAKDPGVLLDALRASRFVWVSSNVVRADGRPFPGVPARTLRRVGGVRVGIFGLTIASQRRNYVSYRTDLGAIARRQAAALRRAGAEVIVALTHLPMEADRRLARTVPGIDLIAGGHEHHAQIEEVGGRTLIAKAASDLKSLWAIEVALPPGGRVERRARLVRLGPSVPRDPSLLARENRWRARLARRLGPDAKVGETRVPLDGLSAHVRSRETNLGNLIADALREGGRCAVAAFNGGGIRNDEVVPPGPLTRHAVAEIFLFPNKLARLALAGNSLAEALEHSAARRGSGGFLQLSGMRVAYSMKAKRGGRLREARVGGRPLEPGREYTLCTNDFLAEGGDGYTVLRDRGRRLPAEAVSPRDLLIRYLRARGAVSPRVEGRIRFLEE